MTRRMFYNPHARSLFADPGPSREPLAFHRRLPDYAPTRLVAAPDLARALQVGQVWIKDESRRLGLPAFKMLGATWAIYRALAERMGHPLRPWNTLDELAAQLAPLCPLTLAAATDGNHGRAVAHVAAQLGFEARIFLPAGTSQARMQAITDEGATVIVVDGTYDDAVRCSAREAGPRCLVISDTAWPGYEQIPRWVIEGYSTIFWEIDDELARRGEPGPTVVVTQVGVGAFATAAVRHYRRPEVDPVPKIISVEPTSAACALASAEAGHIVTLDGPLDSIMGGLNCAAPSPLAWPVLSSGVNLFIAIDDDRARQGMRDLAAAGVVAGETGAAGMGGLIALLTGDQAEHTRAVLGIDHTTRVLLVSTEGATDPILYQEIVGHAPGSSAADPGLYEQAVGHPARS